MNRTCSNDRYHGKQLPKDRRTAGERKGAKHNIYATNRLSDDLQLDNIYSTNSLSLESDLNYTSNDRYHGKQHPKDRPTVGKRNGAKHNIYATNRLSDDLQLDNIYSTNSLSLDSDLK
ncbi:hypothetical protein P8452_52183 [Trifolium repens]|nr:hypothetical protein P8452_52183 [Trifolium repens]